MIDKRCECQDCDCKNPAEDHGMCFDCWNHEREPKPDYSPITDEEVREEMARVQRELK